MSSAVVSGLAAINQKLAERSGGKAKWLKLDDGEAVTIQIVSELSPDSPAYDEGRGLVLGVAEHTNPRNFKRKAVCTRSSEDACFGCEMAIANPKKGWASKIKMYTNVYVIPKKGDPYAAIWSVPVNEKSTLYQTIQAYFEANDSVSNTYWNLKRSGANFNNTTYTLLPGKPADFDFPETIEFYDLAKVAIREIPYAEQEAFYMNDGSDKPDDDEPFASGDKDLTTAWT